MAVLAIGTARAETDPTEAARAYFTSAAHLALANEGIARARDMVMPECKEATAGQGGVHMFQPLVFGPDGTPRGGAWKIWAPVTGCGMTVVLNLFVSVRGDGRVLPTIALPGETHADPQLQIDAMRLVRTTTAGQVTGCANAAVVPLNTRFETFDPVIPGASRRPWHETWTMRACDRKLDVPVAFVPRGNQTDIAIDVAKIVVR
jgi:hypothetical protein